MKTHPYFTPEQRERFFQLIKFLERLPKKKFNFGHVVESVDENNCGSVCCAIGWTPALFPDLVQWNGKSRTPWALSTNGNWAYYPDVASELFGIDPSIAGDLFTPEDQGFIHPELGCVYEDESPKRVASVMRKFDKLLKEGKIKIP